MRSFFALFSSLLVAGCVRLDPDHCANQENPSDYCGGKYCSSCESEEHGCLVSRPDEACNAGGPVADTGSTTAEPTSGSSMSATMSSTSVDSTTTTEPTMTMSTTESMDSSTTEDIEPGCGNNVVERELDENCDGTDMPAAECSDVALAGGSLGCYAPGEPLECTYDLSECTGASQCGNNVIEGTEPCDGTDLNDQTCESLSENYIGGELTCTSCAFNTSACELCLMEGEDCEMSSQCCGNNVCSIIMGMTCGDI